jgi:hypothetical protein
LSWKKEFRATRSTKITFLSFATLGSGEKKHFCASNKRFLINIYTCPCASNIKYERRRKTRKKPGEKIIFEKIFKRENKIPPAKAACKG